MVEVVGEVSVVGSVTVVGVVEVVGEVSVVGWSIVVHQTVHYIAKSGYTHQFQGEKPWVQ